MDFSGQETRPRLYRQGAPSGFKILRRCCTDLRYVLLSYSFSLTYSEIIQKQRRAVKSGPTVPAKPKMFHLSVNYRSHAGIVNCAHAVIELISKYFPYSIDTLPRERGMTNGPMPIFYQDVYPEFLQKVRDIRCE